MAKAKPPKGDEAAKVITGRRDTRRGRYYDISNGDAYPSVTTVLNVLAKPALIGWAARIERSAVLAASGEVYAGLKEIVKWIPREEFQSQVEELIGTQKAHTKQLRVAADIGTQVHKKIEWDIIATMLDRKQEDLEAFANHVAKEPALTHPKAEESWQKYLAWKVSVRMEPLASERAIVSHVHKYAGTEDLLVRIWPPYDDPIWGVALRPANFETVGLVVTGDFKTGKSVYGEMFLQNGAYRLAEKEMGYEPDSQAGIIIRLPKEADDPGFEVVPVPPLEETIPGFLALRAAFNWHRKDEERYERQRAAKREKEEEARKAASPTGEADAQAA